MHVCQMRSVHVGPVPVDRDLIQRDPDVHEDRHKEAPYCLSLPTLSSEWLHLHLCQVLSKNNPKVGPLVIRWL